MEHLKQPINIDAKVQEKVNQEKIKYCLNEGRHYQNQWNFLYWELTLLLDNFHRDEIKSDEAQRSKLSLIIHLCRPL